MTILNVHMPNIRASTHKKKLRTARRKWQTKNCTWRHQHCSLSITESIINDIEDQHAINEHNLIEMYRLFHPTTAESIHGTSKKIHHFWAIREIRKDYEQSKTET